MSLCLFSKGCDAHRFPRVSGDEPAAHRGALQLALFSPRERG